MAIHKNMGMLDRTIRVALAVAIAVLYFTGTLSGLAAAILGSFAVILVITSLVSVCPMYLPFGLSTCKKSG